MSNVPGFRMELSLDVARQPANSITGEQLSQVIQKKALKGAENQEQLDN